jgi:hypothetical protein
MPRCGPGTCPGRTPSTLRMPRRRTRAWRVAGPRTQPLPSPLTRVPLRTRRAGMPGAQRPGARGPGGQALSARGPGGQALSAPGPGGQALSGPGPGGQALSGPGPGGQALSGPGPGTRTQIREMPAGRNQTGVRRGGQVPGGRAPGGDGRMAHGGAGRGGDPGVLRPPRSGISRRSDRGCGTASARRSRRRPRSAVRHPTACPRPRRAGSATRPARTPTSRPPR